MKTKTEWSNNPTILSWFEAKGKLEQLFNKLNLSVYWKAGLPKLYKGLLHPYRTSKLCLAPGLALGIFGQINPILANKCSISPYLYLFEFNLEIIKTDYKYKKLLNYNIYCLYPKVFKDLSFVISKKISFTKIKNLLGLDKKKDSTKTDSIQKPKDLIKDKTKDLIKNLFGKKNTKKKDTTKSN